MRYEKIAQPQGRALDGASGAGAWLQDEMVGLFHPALFVALLLLLLTFLALPRLPLRYSLDVGFEEGLGSDLPFLQGFNTAEKDELGTYRWSDEGARIVVPGVGTRPIVIRLDWLPTPAAVQGVAPKSYRLTAGGIPLGELALRPEGGRQIVLVPASALADGSLELTINTETFTLEGDPRSLGARLSAVEVVGMAGGPASPDWPASLAWLGAVVLAWLSMRAAFGVMSGSIATLLFIYTRLAQLAVPGDTTVRAQARQQMKWLKTLPPISPVPVWVFLVGATMVATAALLDPPRWAFGAHAALVACALAYPLAHGARWALRRLARQLDLPLDSARLGWLAFFITLSFVLRYGGRLYPESMHGDIGFHHNRLNEAVWGLIYIISVNRGVDFPYPPGPYILVAPLALIGLEPRTLLQFGAALADAVSAALVYAIGARAAGGRVGLLAAGVYVFTAATFMTTWWSFDTHIYTQFFHLMLIAGLIWALEAWQGESERERWAWVGGIFVLASLVFLGHFGFLINTALLLGLLGAVIWIAGWRGAAWARRIRWPLTIAVASAGLFAAIFFYSAYIPLFLGQLETAREGGLTAVAGRGPVSRDIMWQRLWRDGLLIHFGLFPLLLMPAGVWLLARGVQGEQGLGPRRAMLWLILGSLAVAGVFAIFPFVAGVTNSPRWLMFIAWTVAVGAALAAERLWDTGWWGRLATLAMGVLVLANTAWVWLGPMLWRMRPPEPF